MLTHLSAHGAEVKPGESMALRTVGPPTELFYSLVCHLSFSTSLTFEVYQHTQEVRYLDTARNMASYFLDNLPADGVVPWSILIPLFILSDLEFLHNCEGTLTRPQPHRGRPTHLPQPSRRTDCCCCLNRRRHWGIGLGRRCGAMQQSELVSHYVWDRLFWC